MVPEILTVAHKKDEKFLRKKTVPFDFKKFTRKEINDLIARMRRVMHAANGIGLSANQIGLDFSVFVAEVPDAHGGTKFYAVFNPKIEKADKATITFEEGCLSVPGKWGEVTRAEQIVVSGCNKMGKPVKVKAWGLLARIFQHEIDHLNGKLFIDRAKKVYASEHTT
ncbi:MAG TPA: peptide deformylase, partial [Candidatus Paceibacterota bacterium]|nr:peptide deformylase [Candidatus Paceibacterota bacterium]